MLLARFHLPYIEELQDKPDLVVRSFEACGILNRLDSEVRPNELLEGQLYTDSSDELDDPFNDAETLMSDSDL